MHRSAHGHLYIACTLCLMVHLKEERQHVLRPSSICCVLLEGRGEGGLYIASPVEDERIKNIHALRRYSCDKLMFKDSAGGNTYVTDRVPDRIVITGSDRL